MWYERYTRKKNKSQAVASYAPPSDVSVNGCVEVLLYHGEITIDD
jgi:DNA polymerase II small subunit/DNA polymerase delta subunit B